MLLQNLKILNSNLHKTLNNLITYYMSLSKEYPSKMGVMQKTGDAVKEKPFRIKGISRSMG